MQGHLKLTVTLQSENLVQSLQGHLCGGSVPWAWYTLPPVFVPLLPPCFHGGFGCTAFAKPLCAQSAYPRLGKEYRCHL